VLTLAFESWPAELTVVKRQVSNVPEFKEAKENFGTRWPKVSLAALRDDAPDISMKDLKELTDACREFDAQLQNLVLRLTGVSIVVMSSRSLEHHLVRIDYPFSKPQDEGAEQIYDEESFEIVREVVAETERLQDYIAKVNQPGNRCQHYNSSIWTESTLVCFISIEQEFSEVLDLFRARVESVLPDMYEWMPRKCLHLSLRALENRTGDRSTGDRSTR